MTPPISTHCVGDIVVHVVVAGWVRVKEAHRTLRGPVATRLVSIALDRRWTEWMPVLVGVIEHPEGVFLVDAGMTEELLEPAYCDCDPITARVYRHLLAFRFDPEQRVDRRLASLDIDPARVRAVVLTHRHADHDAGLVHLPPNAIAYVGARDWPAHAGALPCRWPATREPVLIGASEGHAIGLFASSRPLTKDGRVAIVPLAGHSPGHLGVIVRGEDHDVLLGGDVAFSLDQIASHTIAGIVEDPRAARASLEVVAAQLRTRRTVLVLAHDPRLLEAFGRGEITVLPEEHTPRATG